MSSLAPIIALCSAAGSLTGPAVALCGALPLPEVSGEPPAWIHLLPAGTIVTVDNRGPYHVADPQALIARSLVAGDRLPLDENHSTDLAAPQGQSAPARGWIVELQSRADGIWGRVEWTAAGAQLVVDKAYRHISPVIAHTADKAVTGLLRASLVNRPNLRGLAALHAQGDHMDFLSQLRKALGLKPEADEAAVLAAVASGVSLNAVAKAAGLAEGSTETVVLQAVAAHASQASQASHLAAIAKAAGLADNATGEAVLQAVQALADPAKTVPAGVVTALQAEITGLKTERAREKAVTFVDAAIKAGKIAAPAQMRDHYIARHMADPAAVEKEIGVMPSLHGRGLPTPVPPGQAGDALSPEDRQVIALMGVDPKAYQATKTKLTEEAL